MILTCCSRSKAHQVSNQLLCQAIGHAVGAGRGAAWLGRQLLPQLISRPGLSDVLLDRFLYDRVDNGVCNPVLC